MEQHEIVHGFDTRPVEFGREGNLLYSTQAAALLKAVRDPQVTDLLVLSHGWNNDKAEARTLYGKLLASIEAQGVPALPNGRRLVVLFVYWPSKRFAERDLIPGGVAGSSEDAVDRELDSALTRIEEAFDDPADGRSELLPLIERLRALVPHVEQNDGAADDFVRIVRALFPTRTNDEEEVLGDSFFTVDGPELLRKLGAPFAPKRRQATGGAMMSPGSASPAGQGSVQGLGNLFKGVKNGALNLLNLFTYYEMKERAGTVGSSGVAAIIEQAQKANGSLRVHLCGHSFGGRLVTAALCGREGSPPLRPVHSLVLLQAAFSHWGFAENYDGHRHGVFRRGLGPAYLAGPVLITYTSNDHAVGYAYPLASRLRQQVASGLGDANDPYGGIGRNGAQKTSQVDGSVRELQPVTGSYAGLLPGKVYNLESTKFIANHGDVHGPQVARALLAAMTASAP